MFPFLSNHGILGLNARNLLYIKPFNPKKAVAFADDKLKTKAFLSARGVPAAKVYARIEDHRQLRSFDFSQLPAECVLKPNYGFGGAGIMVLKGRKNGEFLEQGKRAIPEREMCEHIEDILDGKFSVNGLPDSAFFEKLLVSDPCFAPFRPVGLPDIRIIVFNLVPVMAMLRIPTAESGGKANVHMGGIGIGIDIAKGVTTYATQYNKRLFTLPHGAPPSGIEIPRWEELLLIASRIQYITNIGYLAVDLTIDAEQGPVLLEVNARAGLMVQVANMAPLRSRLERVEGLTVSTPEKGVRLARELFGAKSKNASGDIVDDRPVLGLREAITVSGDGMTVDAAAMIVPDRERTLFSKTFLNELRKAGAATPVQGEESTFRVKFTLGGRKIQTVVEEGDIEAPSIRAYIGKRDLAGFLLDPSKETTHSPVRSRAKEDLRAIDKFLSQADEELLLLKHVKPVNLTQEWAKATMDKFYNPVFEYNPWPASFEELESRLITLSIDDSPTGLLFKKKRRELLQRLNLVRSRGDARRFTEASSALFGAPTSVLLASASAMLGDRAACELPPRPSELLTAEQALPFFLDTLKRYGLHDWEAVVDARTVARVTVGGQKITLRADALFSRTIIEALIAHELETHVLTAENGDHQPYGLFRRGFANYLDTQEGLAMFNQNRFLTPFTDKRFGPARNILGLAFALEHSFAETRNYLHTHLGYEPAKALSKAVDFKRGLSDTSLPGAFTKAVVYFRGLRAIEEFAARGGDLKRLYIGKIALEDLDILEQIPGLKKPVILPEFLRENKEVPSSLRQRKVRK